MVPDQIAARALITYHLAEQRPMMGAFLDALGITHENGLIQEENVKPDTAKMRAAVEKISAEFPKADGQIYLHTLLGQDPETWGALKDVVMDWCWMGGWGWGDGVMGDGVMGKMG